MFDNLILGILPFFIQNYILKIGLEHPNAKLIKDEMKKIPPIVYSNHNSSFIYYIFLFGNTNNGTIFKLCTK
tara:strand:+ start:547 stop:762 length:216 start_codon:yes stop_codon:yes gene_type:complete